MPRGEGGGGWGLGPEDGRGASRASGAVMSASRLATGVRGGAEEAGGLEERRPFVARGLDAVNPPVARDPAVLRENSFRVWKSALSTNAERPGPGCRNAVLYEIALVFLIHS